MKVVSDKPVGLNTKDNFVLMGRISDSGKDYACLLDLNKAKETAKKTKEVSTISAVSSALYVEEIHWSGVKGGSIETATLHQIENDEEWSKIVQYVMNKTTIFSPKKIRDIIKYGVYFYSESYFTNEETKKDAEDRKKRGLL